MFDRICLKEQYCEFPELLKGKQALVIGGGTGIGKAIALKLINCGARVIVASRKDRKDNGENVVYEKWDLNETDIIEAKWTEIVDKYGQIDIVINSQGICPDLDFHQQYNEITVEDFDNVINTNLKSVYFVNQIACRYFSKNEIRGHVLNIASTEGLKGSVVPYGISKAGVVSLTKGFGKKYARKQIIVNGIAPGATATDMMSMTADGNLSRGYIPSGRASTPNEIANVALLLVSDFGANMAGEIVVVDGGESLH